MGDYTRAEYQDLHRSPANRTVDGCPVRLLPEVLASRGRQRRCLRVLPRVRRYYLRPPDAGAHHGPVTTEYQRDRRSAQKPKFPRSFARRAHGTQRMKLFVAIISKRRVATININFAVIFFYKNIVVLKVKHLLLIYQ